MRLYRIILGITIVLINIVLINQISVWAEPLPVEGVFPSELQLGYIMRFENLPEEIRSKRLLFNLNKDGRPFVVLDNTLIGLKYQEDSASMSFKISGVKTIDHLAWMQDGALLIISGRKFGVPTGEGFQTILDLPADGMKIEPASGDVAYLYGGDNPSNRRDLYLYKKGGELLQLLRTPLPIQAISGNGNITFVAMGKSIYILGMGKPLTPVYQINDEVTSLAMAPPSGLFYSSKKGVGYINQRSKGYTFLRGKGAELTVHSEDLYLFFPDEGIMRCSPVSSFERLAHSIENSIGSKKHHP